MMGWNHPNPIYYDNCVYDSPLGLQELTLMFLIIWIFLGIVPSLLLTFILFPSSFGLLIPFIIYIFGIGFFVFLWLILDSIELKKLRKKKGTLLHKRGSHDKYIN